MDVEGKRKTVEMFIIGPPGPWRKVVSCIF